MAKQALVTTGATVTFSKLIEFSLATEYVAELMDLGYTDYVVQYGKSEGAKQLVVGLLEKIKRKFELGSNRELQEEENGQLNLTVIHESNKLHIRCIRYDKDIASKYTAESNLVISHAGTGSILDSVRLGKKLIVLINDSLKDNHQLEIAQAFEELNVLKVAKGNLKEFVQLTKKMENCQFEKLAQPKGWILEEVLHSIWNQGQDNHRLSK
ncbi:hypothetical protein FOA43_003291 [Brettanomyces nanus]|uniref:UDP-N-acetylglucosamine transferase subunit ALG13 n=1 Tax=Eeniella nana TaxID=13502 RepID=A0A875S6G6_EENNA|nr:uncharacterized protein FOA43_003291 [Brettanomyces nanus]QPG75905.1 hypothetical protein FOA43_003291 [Brettanomyces nanus]